MTNLTISLSDDIAKRLQFVAHNRGLSIDNLIEELSNQALSTWDLENHFRTTAATGNVQQALDILNRLDEIKI